jgi:hypothetical protein
MTSDINIREGTDQDIILSTSFIQGGKTASRKEYEAHKAIQLKILTILRTTPVISLSVWDRKKEKIDDKDVITLSRSVRLPTWPKLSAEDIMDRIRSIETRDANLVQVYDSILTLPI